MSWQRFDRTKGTCRRFLEENETILIENETLLKLSESLNKKVPLADPAPPWRQFMKSTDFLDKHADNAIERWEKIRGISSERARQKAESFHLADTDACRDLVLAVNAALALRRPLLLTGQPGSGKSTLAFVLAEWLGLGPVLEWPVSPGASLADALATYNPLARLEDLEISQKEASGGQPVGAERRKARPVQDYVRLGPVGTAFLPNALPRVLLIDEIDKGDLNLANDLLHLFEEGKFPIPALQRAEGAESDESAKSEESTKSDEAGETGSARKVSTWCMVSTWDRTDSQPVKARIVGGEVQCHEFPLVVMTSNGERDFPPAFNRRCLRVRMPDFSNDPETLKAIVNSHLGRDERTPQLVEDALAIFGEAVRQEERNGDTLAMDQLLNLAYLLDGSPESERAKGRLRTVLLQGLNRDGALESEAELRGDGER